jgi:hypothetical protein
MKIEKLPNQAYYLNSYFQRNCFALMFSITLYRYSFVVFAYIHNFTEVPRFLMENTVRRDLHLISNLNFSIQFLHQLITTLVHMHEQGTTNKHWVWG